MNSRRFPVMLMERVDDNFVPSLSEKFLQRTSEAQLLPILSYEISVVLCTIFGQASISDTTIYEDSQEVIPTWQAGSLRGTGTDENCASPFLVGFDKAVG